MSDPASPSRPPLPVRPVDAGLVLREASSEEFLPSVRLWVRSAGLVLLGSAAAGVALMAVWPYRVVVRGTGVVRPSGETSVINAPFAGQVRQVLVQPNQRVRAGQVLAVLDPTDLEGKQQQLSQSQRALGLQARALVNQGLAALQSAELEVEKSQAALRFAEAEYRRFQQLAGTGSITVTQLEEKAESYNVARANLAKARQAVAEQRSRSVSDQAQLEKELATNQAEVGQISRDLAKTTVTAPGPGVLFSLNLRNPGQMVAAGEELARIAPSQAGLLVKLLVPSQDITNVEVGQRADLRIAGCPYPDYGTLKAKVVSIAPEASLPSSPDRTAASAAAPPPIQAGGYEVTLRPDGTVLRSKTRSCDLRIGMDLSADITTRLETVLGFLLRKARLSTGV
ncbi:MAG: HlyD family efflux transporter periplasmic adaptor subunit [Prochlorococcaceae cyanobacterium]